MNKIVGNNEYETPEKPISEEEFFFAEILGEAVPPFLKSKGEVKSIIPYTKKEMFLAYAAGEDVDKPTPITREEYFLCYLGDSSASIPDPITRTEKFIAKVYNDAVETPKPTTRLEYIFAYITDGSRDTFDAFTPTTREEHFLLNAAEYIKQHSHITFTLSYYNDDGSVLLYSESVAEGGNGEYKGETPTKASTEQYDYSFVGWSSETGATEPTTDVLKNITADKSVYAAFEPVTKAFDVKFYNADVLLYTDEGVEYGGTAVYSGNTPTKAETAQYTYTFIGWNSNSSASTADDNALTNVTADRTVYAIFTAVPKGYTVYFYNGETLLETVTGVPSGGTATYTGATPTSSQAGYIFSGWSPSNTNITADTSCYAQFKAPYITDSWEVISQRSAAGTAQNYYSVGDCKPIELNGTMGTLALNTTLYVYILGFNHNSTYEPNGITFGCFKTAATNGIDVCLVDSKYGSSDTSGTKYFNMSHRGNYNYGGWKGSDMRYDILGSTDVQPSGYGSAPTTSKTGYDATSTCATNPVANTLMSCLPSDLRAVMKPMTKYTDNKGNNPNVEANVTTSIDYLPLLSVYEVGCTGAYANKYEKNKQAQYTYYSGGNSKVKYSHSATSTAVAWWVRSPYCYSGDRFCRVSTGGAASIVDAGYSLGVAPCFLV